MNKLFISILIICGCTLTSIFITQYLPTITKNVSEKTATHVNKTNNKKIAIITPVTHPSLEKIQQGFVDTLLKNENFKNTTVTIFNANGNEVLLHSQAEEALNRNFDLLFTIGAHATQLAKQIIEKKHKNIPLVFGAVADPISLGIINAQQSPDTTITGVIEEPDHQLQLDLLCLLKPTIKKILLVYNPIQGAGLEKDKVIVEKILQEKDIDLQCLEVYQTNEVYTKTEAVLAKNKPDALLVLIDNTVVPAIDGLTKLCSRYKVTLCSSDLDSVQKGAAFGFGVNEYDYGVEAAKKALLILAENIKTVPATKLTAYKLICNTKTMSAQELKPTPLLMFLLSQASSI